jgi:hypothetical protein
MGDFSVNVRLRPIRFAFMVSPEDMPSLHRIFEVNTCLWGGVFNPIIPVFKRVPVWWERQGPRFESAKQIINGYLDYFEPDLVVEAKRGLAAGFGIDPPRVLQLDEVLGSSDTSDEKGYGQSVLDIYQKLYRQEFQFVRRHRHNIVNVKARSSSFKGLSSCLFGAFPDRDPSNFGGTFNDVFDPDSVTLDATALVKLYKSGFSSALRVGVHGLKVKYNDYSDPSLFILDAFEPRDLLDFWNYRAVHREGIAVPLQWLPELSDLCKDLILRNYRPLPGNPNGVMIRPTNVFSRSIPTDQIDELFKKHLQVDKEGANTLQVWYPSIWRPSPGFSVRRTRPTITASEKRFDVPLDLESPYIRFESLCPEFAAEFGGHDRWANVVRLSDWNNQDRIAKVFPSDFRARALSRFGLASEYVLSTNEGLVTLAKYKNVSQHWRLTEGRQAIESWLQNDKITCQLSESGRATQQIIQTLGGFAGVRSVAHKGVIDLLNGMARRPISRSAQIQKFENEINRAVGHDIWRNAILESLVKRKAVELGYELKCSKCGNWGWHGLNALGATMTCDLCLQQFPFPLTSPSSSSHARWAYRVVGPFALPDYARGGYASALAIRFFSDVLSNMDRAGTTWSPGMELGLPDGKKIEADFVLWYQRKHMLSTDEPTQVVFGEAKSYGQDAFSKRDIERMKSLAELYPGATLVFATLKEADEFSGEEITLMKALARWGREYDSQERGTRAPVIVLTGTELFTPYHLEKVWGDKGGMHKKVAENARTRLDNLRVLADVTQQLYLGMPSYFEWRQAKWKKRRQRLQN